MKFYVSMTRYIPQDVTVMVEADSQAAAEALSAEEIDALIEAQGEQWDTDFGAPGEIAIIEACEWVAEEELG